MKKLLKITGITIALTTVATVIRARDKKQTGNEQLVIGNIESYPSWVQEMIKD